MNNEGHSAWVAEHSRSIPAMSGPLKLPISGSVDWTGIETRVHWILLRKVATIDRCNSIFEKSEIHHIFSGTVSWLRIRETPEASYIYVDRLLLVDRLKRTVYRQIPACELVRFLAFQ